MSVVAYMVGRLTAGMTWKRAVLATALGSTLGASFATWDRNRERAERDEAEARARWARPVDPERSVPAHAVLPAGAFAPPSAPAPIVRTRLPPGGTRELVVQRPVFKPAEPGDPAQSSPAEQPPAAQDPTGPGVPERSPREARLLTELARARLAPPAELEQLFELQRRGKRGNELRGFVRRSFPRNAKLRALTYKYIKAVDRRPRKTRH